MWRAGLVKEGSGMARLVGRVREISILNQSISESSGGSSIVYGISGSGKTFMLKEWFDACFNRIGRKAWHSCVNPLAPAQDFLKSLAAELWLDLNPEEQNFVTIYLQRELGNLFSLSHWLKDSERHFLVDGYVFIEFLKALRSMHETGIVLVIDQLESLSNESRILLKNIVEWKPIGVYLYLGLRTSDYGKESLLTDHGNAFFFKGSNLLEVLPLGPEYEAEYLQAWGIPERAENLHFMEQAVYQKRGWLLEQMKESARLRDLLCWLAKHPYGIPNHQNPYLSEFAALLAALPQIGKIIYFRQQDMFFQSYQYVADIYAHFSVDQNLSTEAPKGNSDWEICQRLHLAMTAGEGHLPAVQAMIERYCVTFSVKMLHDLLETFPDMADFQLHRRLAQYALGGKNCDDLLPEVLAKTRPDMEHPLTALLIHTYSRHARLFKLVEASDSIPQLARHRVMSLFLFGSMQQNPEQTAEGLLKLHITEDFLDAAQSILYFLFSDRPLNKPALRQGHLPGISRLARAIDSLETQDFDNSKSLLEACIRESRRSLDLRLLACSLQKMSDAMQEIDDFERRLQFYRQAVIAGVFTP